MGIIVMLAISVVAFRRARKAGRSVLLWVSLVWLVGLGLGVLVAIAGTCIDVLTASSMTGVAPFFAFWGMAAGNTVGSMAVAVRAGEKQNSN